MVGAEYLDVFAVTHSIVAYAFVFAGVVAMFGAVALLVDSFACYSQRRYRPMAMQTPPNTPTLDQLQTPDPSFFEVWIDGTMQYRVPCEVCADTADKSVVLDLERRYGFKPGTLTTTRETVRKHLEAFVRALHPEARNVAVR